MENELSFKGTNNLTAADINKLNAEDADKALRSRLKSEVLNAPYGQEAPFKNAGRLIEGYYDNHLNAINASQLNTTEKDNLIKALVIQYMHVIQKNDSEVDGLVISAHEIEKLYALDRQLQ